MKKRFISMALMCLMAISLLTSTAFAASSNGSNGTNGKSVLYPNSDITGPGTCRTTGFTASADNGHFIQ